MEASYIEKCFEFLGGFSEKRIFFVGAFSGDLGRVNYWWDTFFKMGTFFVLNQYRAPPREFSMKKQPWLAQHLRFRDKSPVALLTGSKFSLSLLIIICSVFARESI